MARVQVGLLVWQHYSALHEALQPDTQLAKTGDILELQGQQTVHMMHS